MEHVIFGFGLDVQKYLMMEVFLYLIVYSLLIGITGKTAYCMRIREHYSMLIRYKRYSIWWHHVVIKVLIRCLILVGLLFGVGVTIVGIQKGTHTPKEWLIAFVLWLTGICTVALIQAMVIQLGNGYKMMFALLMCVEVISLYFKGLPGSWIMFERSRLGIEGGFSIRTLCGVQFAVIVAIGVFGHCIFKIRRSRGTSN